MRWGRFLASLLILSVAAGTRAAAAGCTLGKLAELPVTMEGLVPTVPAKVDGVDMKLLTDSGAFFSLLTPQAAAKAHMHVGPLPGGFVIGLGGVEEAGLATAKDFSFAGRSLGRADFIVAAPQLGYEVDGLIGNNILSFADVEFDLANGVIRLFKPMGCDSTTNFVYWMPTGAETADIGRPSAPSFKIVVSIKVNGHSMKAVLDSGSPRSFISKSAAREAGVSVNDAGVKPAGLGGGVGRRTYQTWIARFDSFSVGDETVKNALLRIGDTDVSAGGISDEQMLIGADFLLSHRVYVANSERKLYFTYLGGPVFNLDQGDSDTQSGAPAAPAGPLLPGASSDTPTDADGFVRRAAAFDARHEYAAAIADYTQAIALQPSDAHDYYQRGVEHWRAKEFAGAEADFTMALKLKPGDLSSLRGRGATRLALQDVSGANADFEAAAEASPDDHFAAAMDYQRAGLFEKSIAQWDLFVAAHQKDSFAAGALNDRCWTRALWGKELDKALSDCNAAVQQSPKSGDIRDSRGLVYLRLGQYEASIADYDLALKANSSQAWSLYGRGIDKLRLGQKADGEADIAAAVAIDPTLPDVARGYGVSP